MGKHQIGTENKQNNIGWPFGHSIFIYTQPIIHRQGLKNGLRYGWQSIPSEP